jgi:nitronate monooxygenase
MGVAVSSWQLANAVSKRGQLGVVSGTGIAIVMIARLMDGDPGGHVRRALASFPDQEIAERIVKRYYIEGGKAPDKPYIRPTMWTIRPPRELNQLTAIANYVEVWLAKDGHQNPVGINLLEKVQLPNMSSLYGAMLAGVDYVLMGAGIPMQIPGALDAFAEHREASYPLDVIGAAAEDDYRISFNPHDVFPNVPGKVGNLKRPQFLPIVSSVVLAQALQKRANGEVNGFIIEMPTAGGHNAPPRGELRLNEEGEPI